MDENLKLGQSRFESRAATSKQERDTWNARYRNLTRGARSPEPFLVGAYGRFIAPLFPHGGTAIDVAGGTGRHAIYLAEQGVLLAHRQEHGERSPSGWRVTLTDISDVGIQRAREEAQLKNLSLDYICADARQIDFGVERFDLVLVFFYLEREILRRLAAALRPGGIVIYKTYSEEHRKFATHGKENPLYFLRQGELLHAFPGFRILHYEESVVERGVAELVARKPE